MRSELRKLQVHLTVRLGIAAAIVIAFAVSPALAQAQAPGSLAQLGGSDSCIASTVDSECPTTNGTGLSGSEDVAVTPDGQNVYVIGENDDAIAEFTRNSNGSLTQVGCIADIDSEGSCGSNTADGLNGPDAIVISPDSDHVYVAARDDDGNNDIAEFTRNENGTLSELGCIAESSDTSNCASHSASGLQEVAVALAMDSHGDNLYAADRGGEAIAEFSVNSEDGSLSQLDAPNDCIQDANVESGECSSTANGISEVTGIVVSPNGQNVYTSGFTNGGNEQGTIAELTRNSDGSLSQDDPVDCVEDPALTDEGCGSTAVGIDGFSEPVMSPDGKNLYTASQFIAGPIAEFAVNSDGSLSQLPAPNDCIEETGSGLGCGTEGQGIATGQELAMSSDGENVYAAAPSGCEGNCEDVAEFTRNADGSLTQLASPDNCIQDVSEEGDECDNENGLGLGGQGVAISSDGTSVYVTGPNDVAEFARTPPATVTISLAGAGSGAVSDGTGAITCPTTCSHTYAAGSPIMLTAAAGSGSAFAGWSGGGCSGTGTCQLTLSPDTATTHTAVTATFNSVRQQEPRVADAGFDRRAVRGHRWRRGVLGLRESGRPPYHRLLPVRPRQALQPGGHVRYRTTSRRRNLRSSARTSLPTE